MYPSGNPCLTRTPTQWSNIFNINANGSLYLTKLMSNYFLEFGPKPKDELCPEGAIVTMNYRKPGSGPVCGKSQQINNSIFEIVSS